MRELGYHLVYHNDSFSLYQSEIKSFGNIDFVHAKSDTIRKMISRKKSYSIFNDSINVSVISVEDIIGLKLQAIKNDISRTAIDENDILQLLLSPINTIPS